MTLSSNFDEIVPNPTLSLSRCKSCEEEEMSSGKVAAEQEAVDDGQKL